MLYWECALPAYLQAFDRQQAPEQHEDQRSIELDSGNHNLPASGNGRSLETVDEEAYGRTVCLGDC